MPNKRTDLTPLSLRSSASFSSDESENRVCPGIEEMGAVLLRPPQQRVAELGRTWLRLLHGRVLGSGEFSGACAFGAGENSARPTLHERSGRQRSIHVHPCARPLDADLSLVRLVVSLRETRSCSSATLADHWSGPAWKGSCLEPLAVFDRLCDRYRRRSVQLPLVEATL